MILKSAFYIYSTRQMNLSLYKNCSKTQELENHRDLCAPALGPFNYHIKVKCKRLYQFLINLTLLISIRQIFEVLKKRLKYFSCVLCKDLLLLLLKKRLHYFSCVLFKYLLLLLLLFPCGRTIKARGSSPNM